eukprot:77554_1
MAGAVDVAVVAGLGLVLDVGGVDGDLALLLLGGLVDGEVVHGLGVALLGEDGGDGGGEGRLAVVNVADGADDEMGLAALEGLLGGGGDLGGEGQGGLGELAKGGAAEHRCLSVQ